MFQLYLMGVLYAVLGILHFTNTGFYRPFMPKFLPAHDLLIYLSGVAEILLGIGVLFPQTRTIALWGLIAMLIVFLIVHVNMLIPVQWPWNFPLDSLAKVAHSVFINLLGVHQFTKSIFLFGVAFV